jgi:putative DNA methylase
MTASHPIKSPRKLIEVALPLDAINEASAAEKTIRQGHPSSLHLWWARRPLLSARAVIFAQMVNDPGFQQGGGFKYGKNKKEAEKERLRLFRILEELVKWDNSNNETVLEQAREEIRRSWREVCELNKEHPHAQSLFNPDKLPALHDPFAGGGAIPFEAQRLGLQAFATDLNPVAVLINKAMIEIPSLFAGVTPVNPVVQAQRSLLKKEWHALSGLSQDIRYYGEWIREKAFERIGRHYPTMTVTKDMTKGRNDLSPHIGEKLNVIAWIWAKTVRSPNPAFASVHVPLSKSFQLSTKKGSETWVEPIMNAGKGTYDFRVTTEGPPAISETVGRKGGVCIMSHTPIPLSYIRKEAMAGQMGQRLMAIAAQGPRGRIYLSPTEDMIAAAKVDLTGVEVPDAKIDHWPGCTNCVVYGFENFAQLFTPRQTLALTTLSDLIKEVKNQIINDGKGVLLDDGIPLADGGKGLNAYADAISLYLSFALDKLADLANCLCAWEPIAQCPRHLFGRQAIPMTWDFAEGNPLGDSSGSWKVCLSGLALALEKCFGQSNVSAIPGIASQVDATEQAVSEGKVVCTDPPYYDNVPYSNISDFFYIWLRRTLRPAFPSLFATMTVPKLPELVANQFRHDGKENAFDFFMKGMEKAIHNVGALAHPAFPVTIYYAFKQSDSASGDTTSSGWETFLEGVLKAGFSILGTWPMRTENATRLRGQTSNALASSVVLVCRQRLDTASAISRREFIRELNQVLPDAIDEMTRGVGGEQSPVAPVDLSQAVIGPGMAVYSKYSAVLEADGSPMSVRTALQLINRFLAEDDFDADTQFCLHWFEQHGWESGKFGEADTLARAKGTSVEGVKNAGVLYSAGGSVRLLKWAEYQNDWDPKTDQRLPIWEVLHQLIRVFNTDGETGAAAVFAAVQSKAEAARQLAYRLYTLCERKNWAEDARAYNEVVTSWSGIESAAAKEPTATQRMLFDN